MYEGSINILLLLFQLCGFEIFLNKKLGNIKTGGIEVGIFGEHRQA